MSLSTDLCRFLSACPLLPATPEAELLQPDMGAWALIRTKGEKTLKTYTDGGHIYEAPFLLSCRLPFGMEDTQEENMALLEEVCRWVTAQVRKGNLPVLNEERFSVDLTAGTPHAALTLPGQAQYETELKLIYYYIH